MREKNVRHIDPIHAHVYGFSTCEKERFCEGVLWGKFTQVSCSSNSTTACSTQQHMNLGAWPLKYGREGMGIFWHADFSELLNENTAYLGKSLQKKFCRLTFFFFLKNVNSGTVNSTLKDSTCWQGNQKPSLMMTHSPNGFLVLYSHDSVKSVSLFV